MSHVRGVDRRRPGDESNRRCRVADVPTSPIVTGSNATDDEVVAIMAAMEALWPRPVVDTDATVARNTAWHFSGRWWARPVTVRDRPRR